MSGNKSIGREIIILMSFILFIAICICIFFSTRSGISRRDAIEIFERQGADVGYYLTDRQALWSLAWCAIMPKYVHDKLYLHITTRFPDIYYKPYVESIRFHRNNLDDETTKKLIEALPPLNDVELCNFKNSCADDEFLKNMRSFKKLKTLSLKNCPVSDDSVGGLLKSLPEFPSSLDLSGTKCRGEFFSCIVKNPAKATGLDNISLANTDCDDESLQALPKYLGIAIYPGLASLDLSNTKVGDKLTSKLPPNNTIRKLNLSKTGIGDESLRNLTRIEKLTSLDLSGTRISDDGIGELAKLEELSYLKVADTEISDKSLPILAKLAKLRWLDLGGTKISPEAIDGFSEENQKITVFF